jgi:hypothetical protein
MSAKRPRHRFGQRLAICSAILGLSTVTAATAAPAVITFEGMIAFALKPGHKAAVALLVNSLTAKGSSGDDFLPHLPYLEFNCSDLYVAAEEASCRTLSADSPLAGTRKGLLLAAGYDIEIHADSGVVDTLKPTTSDGMHIPRLAPLDIVVPQAASLRPEVLNPLPDANLTKYVLARVYLREGDLESGRVDEHSPWLFDDGAGTTQQRQLTMESTLSLTASQFFTVTLIRFADKQKLTLKFKAGRNCSL